MSDLTKLELVTPEELLLSQEAKLVVVPGSEGDFGVLPKHSPLVSTLRPGLVKIYEKGLEGGVSQRLFVAGGFAEVTGESCTILAEEAVSADKINAKTAQARQDAAQSALASAETAGARSQATRELAIASAMVEACEGFSI